MRHLPLLGTLLAFALFVYATTLYPGGTRLDIATVVFAFLVVTPLHHVMVSIALLCFLVASLTLTHWLYLRNHRGLLALGVLAIALPLVNAVLFYGQIGAQWLPMVQKSGKFAAFIWLFAVYYAALRPRK